MVATSPPSAQIEWAELGEMAAAGALGVAVITAFAFGLRGAIASTDAWRTNDRGRAAAFGSMAGAAFAVAAAIVLYGLAVIVRDGPLA